MIGVQDLVQRRKILCQKSSETQTGVYDGLDHVMHLQIISTTNLAHEHDVQVHS